VTPSQGCLFQPSHPVGNMSDKYHPDKHWNIKYNKEVKEEKKVDRAVEQQLDHINSIFYSLSLEDKKTVLEKLKDIN